MIDIVPTLLELTGTQRPATVAGMPVPPLPGKSLVPVFAKDNTVQHDFLWWNHDGNRAIRMGDWKLVADHTIPWELFNLANDRSEMKNLAARYPDKVQEMEQAWLKHAKELHALAEQDLAPKGSGRSRPTAKSEVD